jgi:D-tyrosyl-tRNA(Tyr) deacylase
MRILVQRVKNAQVIVDSHEIASISKGLLLFVGVGREDDKQDAQYLAGKIVNLRIFEDDSGKMNLAIRQVNGEILSVPQFTLYADTLAGNRPGFEQSAEPIKARELWEEFNSLLLENSVVIKKGAFGKNMQVGLVNDGPVTIWLDSKQKSLD